MRWPGLTQLLLLLNSRAFAEPAEYGETVILLQPTRPTPALRSCLTRIRDELSADRYRVIQTDRDTNNESTTVVENPNPADAPHTVLVLLGDPETGTAELGIVRRIAERSAIRHATVVDTPERMPEALASKALELLRATALELSLAVARTPRSQGRPERPLPPSAPTGSRLPAPNVFAVSLDMGLAVWSSIEGPPVAVVPVGRLGLQLTGWSQVRVSAAGLGTRPLVKSEYGTAAISQSYALLELALTPRLNSPVHPLLSAGVGVLNIAMYGSGLPPYEGLSAQQWSAAFDGGGGVALALGQHTRLAMEIHALLASPHPVIRFVDRRLATIGAPSLLFAVTLRVAP